MFKSNDQGPFENVLIYVNSSVPLQIYFSGKWSEEALLSFLILDLLYN